MKFALKSLAFHMAAELRPHGVAAVSITPGFSGRNVCWRDSVSPSLGQGFSFRELAYSYGFTDADSRRPDWDAACAAAQQAAFPGTDSGQTPTGSKPRTDRARMVSGLLRSGRRVNNPPQADSLPHNCYILGA